eukprot:5540268-Prorocentrum_lima.AAC.1
MFGLGSRVPKSIDASRIDKHSNDQQITLRVGTLEPMETSGGVAKVLRELRLLEDPPRIGSTTSGASAGKAPPPVLGKTSG